MVIEPRFSWPGGPGREWTEAARLAALRSLLEPPLMGVMSGWVSQRLARRAATWTDVERMWRECLEARGASAIAAFEGTGDFSMHVREWVVDVEHRILCLSASSWTTLEREMVLFWVFADAQLRWQTGVAFRAGVAPDGLGDAVNGFWVTQGFDSAKGVLANYAHAETWPGGCKVHFLGFVRTALRNYCWHVAKKQSVERGRSVSLDDDGGDSLPPAPVSPLAPADQVAQESECAGVLRAALARCSSNMTPLRRRVLRALLAGLDRKAIADELDITENHVGVSAHGIRRRLRTCLQEQAAAHRGLAECLSQNGFHGSA